MVEHKIDLWRFKWELDNLKLKEHKKDATIFYGSSTFAFWKDIETIFSKYNAINLGFGGSTSDEALYHYDEVARPFNAKTMVWYFGDNEPVCGYNEDETIELFMATWNRFLEDNKDIKIIAIATKTSPARDEYASYVVNINKRVKELADQYSWLTYIETYDICHDENGNYILENYMPDQLHFSPAGYAILKEKLEKVL